jgi:hypothetical protein
MRPILIAKFSDPQLRALLLNTRNSQLVETNAGDAFWGGGCSTQELYKFRKGPLPGANIMGRLLEQIRNHQNQGTPQGPKTIIIGDETRAHEPNNKDNTEINSIIWPSASTGQIIRVAAICAGPSVKTIIFKPSLKLLYHKNGERVRPIDIARKVRGTIEAIRYEGNNATNIKIMAYDPPNEETNPRGHKVAKLANKVLKDYVSTKMEGMVVIEPDHPMFL